MERKTICQIELDSPGGRLSLISDQSSKENNMTNPENLDKITHDIRSSINVIIGYTQMMLDETTGKINAEQRRALQDILDSGNRLYSLTDNIIKRLETASEKK